MKINLGASFKRKVLLSIAVIGLFYFFFKIKNILLPFILAIIIAYILNPLVEKIEKYKIKRLHGILIVYILLIGIISVIALYGIPAIIKQLTAFGEQIPVYTTELQARLRDFYKSYQRFDIPDSLRESIDKNINHFQVILIQALSNLISGFFNMFSQVLNLIIAPILAFYMLKDQEEMSKHLVHIFPISIRTEVLTLWEDIDTVLTRFIRGNLLVASIVGLATSLGLAIIGLDFPVLFGLIAGITNIIPYFGPLIGALPALLFASLTSKKLVLYVILVTIVVQQLEANLISPKILGICTGLHPLLVIFALLAGGELWGVIGLLIAVPLAAVLKIIISYLFVKLTS